MQSTTPATRTDGILSTTVIEPAARTCPNCQTPMHGPFCYQCGQHERSSLRHVGLLFRDFLDDVLNLDSRAVRTLKPLLFRPGFLTLEFFAGRRQRYVPPLRLYVIASLIFFLVAGFLVSSSNGVVEFDGGEAAANKQPTHPAQGNDAEQVTDGKLPNEKELQNEAELRQAMADPELAKALEQAPPAVKKMLAQKAAAGAIPPVPAVPNKENIGIKIGEDDDVVGAQIPENIEFLPAFANEWLATTNKELREKSKNIRNDPRKLVTAVLSVLPQSMFILLPLFALLLKLFYPFANRLYMEHLIVALHSHCFMFFLFTLLFSLNYVVRDATGLAITFPLVEDVLGFVTGTSLVLGVPSYLYLMQKRVYGQSHMLTAFKFFMIGIVYVTLLSIVVAVDIVLGILRM
ncbi:DUF3667 domain-containing protein [Permianibacter sp. IMCC34836]|uniref:DUF3667 domain-containing protein n=1 Tax=Permianibacter fluminis TaxID=2738515 RepID=UPI001551D7A7|nr:DUF3667 domain-containing protein [Permianibacter fluminis]NQD37103.1 DUF3667 domain-containing protein [Permianibacter fluminis]